MKHERRHQSTGNLFIETDNPRRGTPSGVTASESHLWVTVLADSVWAVSTEGLRSHVTTLVPGPGVRRLERVGDGNSSGFVVRADLLLGGLYRRLDDSPVLPAQLGRVLRGP